MAKWAGNPYEDAKDRVFSWVEAELFQETVSAVEMVRLLAELIAYLAEYMPDPKKEDRP